MKMLLLGGNGMAGHMIASYLRRTTDHELIITVRATSEERTGPDSGAGAASSERTEPRVRTLDVRDLTAVAMLVEETKPDVIVNAIGLLNQQAEDHPLDAYLVNGLLPHWLRHLGKREGARVVHVSSDCVFSGDRGDYGLDEVPDGQSVYARSKALGEIRGPGCLTIRTSIIGPEIRPNGIGLMQWFLSSQGQVSGYVNVKWNGVTTLELAKAIVWALDRPELDGLVHLTAPEAISKHDLLLLMQRTFDKNDVAVAPDPQPVIDRTLSPGPRTWRYRTPDYPVMLRELRRWMIEA